MNDQGLPIEDFIQAITSQLDRTQEALALKAQAGLPLTFAVKDLRLDLRTHVDMQGSVVRIRPAGPSDGDASMLHLELSTITKPMIEENTRSLAQSSKETSLRDALGDDLTDEDERRLEWAGIRSVEQLNALRSGQGDAALNRATRLPVQRLWSQLQDASRPEIHEVVPEHRFPDRAGPDHRAPDTGDTQPVEPPLLRIRGRNLHGRGGPALRLRGEPLEVIASSADEIVARPFAHQLGGVLELETSGGHATVATGDTAPTSGLAQAGGAR